MNGFKRFCLVVFAVCGTLVLAALLLPWVGPWTVEAAGLIALDWYLFLVELFALVCVVGFVCALVVAVRSKRPSDIEVMDGDGGRVSIARSAVASQATYLVEADGTCVAAKVVVDVRHDTVDVAVWVEPYRSLDVRAEAERLQVRLRRGLEVLVGDRLGDIALRFLEPRQTSDITPGRDVREARGADGSYVPTAVHEADRAVRHASGAAPERPQDFGVAVPMKGHGAPAQPPSPGDGADDVAGPASAVSVRVQPSESRKGVETDG